MVVGRFSCGCCDITEQGEEEEQGEKEEQGQQEEGDQGEDLQQVGAVPLVILRRNLQVCHLVTPLRL